MNKLDLEKQLPFLTDFQKENLKEIIAYNEVMKHVKFEIKSSPIGPVSLFSKDPEEVAKRKALFEEQEQEKIQKEQQLKKINGAIAYAYSKIKL